MNETTNVTTSAAGAMKPDQKYYALFATQGGDEHGGNFALSYKDHFGNTHHTLPWQTPHAEDMKIFRMLTIDNVVVMGANTYQSLGCVPLKNRINIVVTSKFCGEMFGPKIQQNTRLFYVKSVDDAIELAVGKYSDRHVFFIGGMKLLDDVLSRKDFLDGIYHSKISNTWPVANILGALDRTASTYSIRKPVLEDYRLVAQKLGSVAGHGLTVRCSFWKRSKVPQDDISVAISVLGEREDDTVFQQRSLHQVLMAAEDAKLKTDQATKASTTTTVVATPESLDALLSNLNQRTVESVTRPAGVVRDRSMAVVDPFDMQSTELEAKALVKEFVFNELVKKGLVTPPVAASKDEVVAEPATDFVGVANEIGALLVVKDAAYGSAFEKTKEIFKILFPTGLPVDAYDDALSIMRILDKICRLGVLCTNPEKNKTTERSEDAWMDIAGYSIKALCEQRRRQTVTSDKEAKDKDKGDTNKQ